MVLARKKKDIFRGWMVPGKHEKIGEGETVIAMVISDQLGFS